MPTEPIKIPRNAKKTEQATCARAHQILSFTQIYNDPKEQTNPLPPPDITVSIINQHRLKKGGKSVPTPVPTATCRSSLPTPPSIQKEPMDQQTMQRQPMQTISTSQPYQLSATQLVDSQYQLVNMKIPPHLQLAPPIITKTFSNPLSTISSQAKPGRKSGKYPPLAPSKTAAAVPQKRKSRKRRASQPLQKDEQLPIPTEAYRTVKGTDQSGRRKISHENKPVNNADQQPKEIGTWLQVPASTWDGKYRGSEDSLGSPNADSAYATRSPTISLNGNIREGQEELVPRDQAKVAFDSLSNVPLSPESNRGESLYSQLNADCQEEFERLASFFQTNDTERGWDLANEPGYLSAPNVATPFQSHLGDYPINDLGDNYNYALTGPSEFEVTGLLPDLPAGLMHNEDGEIAVNVGETIALREPMGDFNYEGLNYFVPELAPTMEGYNSAPWPTADSVIPALSTPDTCSMPPPPLPPTDKHRPKKPAVQIQRTKSARETVPKLPRELIRDLVVPEGGNVTLIYPFIESYKLQHDKRRTQEENERQSGAASSTNAELLPNFLEIGRSRTFSEERFTYLTTVIAVTLQEFGAACHEPLPIAPELTLAQPRTGEEELTNDSDEPKSPSSADPSEHKSSQSTTGGELEKTSVESKATSFSTIQEPPKLGYVRGVKCIIDASAPPKEQKKQTPRQEISHQKKGGCLMWFSRLDEHLDHFLLERLYDLRDDGRMLGEAGECCIWFDSVSF